MSESQIRSIKSYISAEISGSEVSAHDETQTGETVILVHDRECQYTLRVDEDFLAAYPEREIPDLLRRWHVANELTRSEGMPLTLTAAGVRLASSN
jgi:hypothetical protein